MYAQHTNKIDEVWAKLPSADRAVLVGHSNDDLTAEDRAKVGKVLAALGAQARAQRNAAGRPAGGGRVNTRRRKRLVGV